MNFMPKIYIVIPTYNEKANIKKLLARIFDLGIDSLYVLVVDDNSPDGTGKIVDQLKQNNSQLDILHRGQKQGLGKAYLAGFEKALSQGADYIFEMDADFSHDPKYIPKFLTAIQNSDLVLGSRYVVGGGVANWNLVRRLISRWGNIYARFVLGLPFYDLTGGFKCYRRGPLEQIIKSEPSSLGYNFQIETTYQAFKLGFRIKEIPIIFTERIEGQSKFNLKIVLEGFWKVIMLRLKSKK